MATVPDKARPHIPVDPHIPSDLERIWIAAGATTMAATAQQQQKPTEPKK